MIDDARRTTTGGLSLLGFFAIAASMVMAVYAYSTFAASGFALVFFLLLAGALWCIPVALCAAEMATVEGWAEGGVFTWVSNTLGERWGFAAIAFNYLEICIGFTMMLYFIVGALSHVLAWPALNAEPLPKTIACLVILWGLGLSQLAGTSLTEKIARIGFFAGILLPTLVLVGMAIAWAASGAPLAIRFDVHTFLPDFTSLGTLVVFVAFILNYMGVEASATHIGELRQPGRNYPLAMALVVTVIVVLSSLGGLAIAMTIPHTEINLSAGVFQAFDVLVAHFGAGLGWIARVLAALLMLGVAAEVASWIVGPSLGMLVTAQRGLLPQRFAHVNRHGVPVALVLAQLVLTSLAIVVVTNAGGGNNVSFLIAMALTVVLYLCTYFLLFLGYVQFVRRQSAKPRAFRVPGGNGVRIGIAVVGIVMSVLAFLISFVPPTLPGHESTDRYVALLAIAFLVAFAIPFVVYALHTKTGKTVNFHLVRIDAREALRRHFWTPPHLRPTHRVIVEATPRPVAVPANEPAAADG